MKELAQIAVTAVEQRKKRGGDRKGFLYFLRDAKDPDTDQYLPDGN